MMSVLGLLIHVAHLMELYYQTEIFKELRFDCRQNQVWDNWQSWHFLFNAEPDLPEELFRGCERILQQLLRRRVVDFNVSFQENDPTEYECVYQMLGGMRDILGYHRAVLEEFEQNKFIKSVLIDIPLVVLAKMGSAPSIFETINMLIRRKFGKWASSIQRNNLTYWRKLCQIFSFIILHNFVNADTNS